VMPGQPGWFNGHRSKRVAEEVSQNLTLQGPLSLLLGFEFRLRPVVVVFKVFDNPISQSADITERSAHYTIQSTKSDYFGRAVIVADVRKVIPPRLQVLTSRPSVTV